MITAALRWAFPWDAKGERRYPGHVRGVLSLFSRPRTAQSVSKWRVGERRMQPSEARELYDHIVNRCRAGMAHAEALKAYYEAEEARPKHRTGYRAAGR